MKHRLEATAMRPGDLLIRLLLAATLAATLAVLLVAWAPALRPGAAALLHRALPRWPVLLGHSAIVVSLAAGGALLIATPLALLLARSNLPARRRLLACLLGLAGVPVSAAAVGVFSIIPPAWGFQSPLICGLLYAVVMAPLAAAVLTVGLLRSDASAERAALLDASPQAVLWHVTLPQSRRLLAAVAILVAVRVGTDITLTDRLLVRTFAEEVYTQYQLRLSAAGPVLAGLPTMILLTMMLLAGWRLLRDPARRLLEASAETHPPRLIHLPPAVRSLARWLGWLIVLWLLALLIAGVQRAGGPERVLRALRSVLPDLLHSLLVTALTAAIVAPVSIGFAFLLVRGPRVVSFAVVIALILLLATPGPVIGISLIHLLNHPDLRGAIYDSPAIVVAALYLRTLGVGLLIACAAVWRIPDALFELARIDGAELPALLRHVVWPQARPADAIVALVAGLLAFGEASASVLVVPPGFSTAAVRVFTLLHYGIYRDVAVLSVCCAAVAFSGGLCLAWLLRVRRG